MCGIAGIISSVPNKFSLQDVQEMSSCLSHRGPDGKGVWGNEDSTAILGHNRLAIIDLSAAGAQPMHYLDRYTIVHNGEVYNYRELREQLVTHGYSFTSSSDTEVILAAYDRWKESCLQYFEGMFAFAIWDQKERHLFLARDRFGEKPLFFYVDHTDNTLWFASELKSFYRQGFNRKDYNGNLLLQYLANGVSYTGDPYQTFHEDILKLPARHYLSFSPFNDSSVLNIQPYYDVDKQNRIDISPGDAVETFRQLFFQSVKRRLRSDVEVGTSLSGGLDSAAVVAAMQQMKKNSQQVFTASFPGFVNDETQRARLVAGKFDLQHHLTMPTAQSLVTDLEKFFEHHDEPVSSSSVYAQYKVYELSRQHDVKVILDGQGADEILAGYKRYVHWFLQELYRRGRKEQFREAQAQFPAVFGWKHKLAATFPAWASILLEKKAFSRQLRHPGLSREFIRSHAKREKVYKPAIRNLGDVLYADVFGGLEELLRNADRNAMAHGVEVRLPFLDHSLVEFVFSLPSHYKLQSGYSKYLLRQSMNDMLPSEIVWRKDKIGFEPPQMEWMQDPRLQAKVHEAKKVLVKEGILNAKAVDAPVVPKDAHAADNFDWRYLSAAAMLT